MNRAWIENTKLLAKSAARAAAVLFTYGVVATLSSWIALGFAAGDLFNEVMVGGGRFAAHSGGGGGPLILVFLVIFLFMTPQGWVTLVYLAGFPLIGLLLGKQQAIRAAIHRVLREKITIISDLLLGFSMEVAGGIAQKPGAERAGSVARQLNKAVGALQGSFFIRFLLRNVLKAIRVDELLLATDFVARVKTDPDGAREQLRAGIEPRLVALAGKASWKPLSILVGSVALLTALRGIWVPWLPVP
jgi:hypothetical protein